MIHDWETILENFARAEELICQQHTRRVLAARRACAQECAASRRKLDEALEELNRDLDRLIRIDEIQREAGHV